MRSGLSLILFLLSAQPAFAAKVSVGNPGAGVGAVPGSVGSAGASLSGAAPLAMPQPGLTIAAPGAGALPSIPTQVLAAGLRQTLPQISAAALQVAQAQTPALAQSAAGTLSVGKDGGHAVAVADAALLSALNAPNPAAALNKLAERFRGDDSTEDLAQSLSELASYDSPVLRRVAGRLGELQQDLLRAINEGGLDAFLAQKMDQAQVRAGQDFSPAPLVTALDGAWTPASPAAGGLQAARAKVGEFKAAVTAGLAAADAIRAIGKVSAFHENDPAKVVVMHEPGSELLFANGHPDAALFTRPVDWKKARAEHAAYRKALEAKGVKVFLVKDVLLEGTLDENGDAVPGPALNALREFAGQFLTYDTRALNREFNRLQRWAEKLPAGPYRTDALEKLAEMKRRISPEEQERYRQSELAKLSPEALVDLVLNQPTVELHLQSRKGKEAFYVGFDQKVSIKPVMNLYFARDQQITTQKGVVISNLSFDQRKPETRIMKFAFEKMGVPIVTEIKKGTLDGGDYIPAGNLVFQGQGLRTNAGAVRQLLQEDAYGAEEVAVVRDVTDQSMDRMHLDTVFNLLSDNQAVALEDIFTDPKKRRVVDLYRRASEEGLPNSVGRYVKVADGQDFAAFLKGRGFKVATVTNEEQLAYATNFLNVGNGQILTPFGGERYLAMLRDMGIDVQYVPMKNLTDGYGAAHCMTQVVLRAPRTPNAVQ